jgi:hypothetical protein
MRPNLPVLTSCVGLAWLGLTCGLNLFAMYQAPDIETVPTTRLIANLQKRLGAGLVESNRYQVGEEIKIWTWSQSTLNGNYTIDANGFVRLPEVGKVKVAGRTRDEVMLELNGTANSNDKNFRGRFVEQSWQQRKGRLLPGETAQIHYELARVYSIAYAQKPRDFQALKGGDRPFLGFGAGADLPPDRSRFRSAGPVPNGAEDEVTDQQSRTNLELAVPQFREALRLQTNHLAAQIGLAWCLDQEGKKVEARRAYERALGLAWDKEKAQDHILEVSFVEEIIGYLRPLLDPTKDAAQLAELDKYSKSILAKGRAITPILFPLQAESSFAELVNANAYVTFDLDGSGLSRQWGWITPRGAWLVYDPDHRGQIASGLQLFGNVTFWVFWKNGYEALGRLDNDQDGWLQGEELKGLAAWQDLNGNGVSDPGEVRPLDDLGVIGVSTAWQTGPDGLLFNPSGIKLRDGSSRATFDWMARCPNR